MTAPTALTAITPHLMIRDARAAEAIEFYETAFGAKEVYRQAADGGERLMHAHLQLDGASLMLHDDFPEMRGDGEPPAPSGTVIHYESPDADAAWQRALAAGATIRFPIADQFWGARYGQLDDPFGHTWSIGGPLKERS